MLVPRKTKLCQRSFIKFLLLYLSCVPWILEQPLCGYQPLSSQQVRSLLGQNFRIRLSEIFGWTTAMGVENTSEIPAKSWQLWKERCYDVRKSAEMILGRVDVPTFILINLQTANGSLCGAFYLMSKIHAEGLISPAEGRTNSGLQYALLPLGSYS